MENRKLKILYFGPIAPKGKPSAGGFESANRKNIDALQRQGVEVVEFPHPVINRKLGPVGKLAYVQMLLAPVKLWRYRHARGVVLHTTPLYTHLLYPTLCTVRAARLLHIPVLLDLRAGALLRCWERKTCVFRRHLKELVGKADAVTVESRTYIEPIKTVIGVDTVATYLPNVADCRQLPPVDKPRGHYNIFYFGRVTQSKGIAVMLQAIAQLDCRFTLYIAGPFGPSCNRDMLERCPRVKYLGFLSPHQLQDYLKMMHFFIFPTSHPGEGQSNSLIEAMAHGLIPVVSNQGFNAEVVGDTGRVLPQGSTGRDYALAIKTLADGDLGKQAWRCQQQIAQCHNLDLEISKLIAVYHTLA